MDRLETLHQRSEELHRDSGAAHSSIQGAVFDLEMIAEQISRLHPELAKDLMQIAGHVEKARARIQGNSAELLNLEYQEHQDSMANVFMKLLDRAAPKEK